MSKLHTMDEVAVFCQPGEEEEWRISFPDIKFDFFAEAPKPPYLLKKKGSFHLKAGPDTEFADLEINFLHAFYQNRRRSFKGRAEPIIKAIGLKNKNSLILDATAGLGREAYLLATFGYRVIACELSPYLYVLLKSAEQKIWEHLKISLERRRLDFQYGDFSEVIEAKKLQPEIIYLDPMFPESPNSAKVKKEMQVLKSLDLGKFEDREMLEKARSLALERVVIKRPSYSSVLDAKSCAEYYENDTVRFEVYMPFSKR